MHLSHLVSDDVSKTLVPCEKGRRHECQAGVLHASIWKRGRHAEHIISRPCVRTGESFCCLQEFFCFGEVCSGCINYFWLCPHTHSVTERIQMRAIIVNMSSGVHAMLQSLPGNYLMSRKLRSPAARAIKYALVGTGCLHLKVPFFSPLTSSARALINTVHHSGALTVAV